MRLPVRQIQAYLTSLHGLSISSGEIINLACRMKAQLEPRLAEVKQQIRASPAVQMVERFLPELVVFVAVPGVPSENNLAERSVRPLVIAPKISGGTRSPEAVRPAWASLVSLAPSRRRRLNPFLRCLTVLSKK